MNLAAHLHRQREWSERTFGPGPRTAALVDHIHKETLEIVLAPADPEEWIDVAILAFDGALRTGATPEQIVEILTGKQAKNEVRRWPDPTVADSDKSAEHLRPEAPTPHVFKVGDRVRFARRVGAESEHTDAPPIGWAGVIDEDDGSELPLRVVGEVWARGRQWSWWFVHAALDPAMSA